MLESMKHQSVFFDLGSILIKPVQRILKYPLLLNALYKVRTCYSCAFFIPGLSRHLDSLVYFFMLPCLLCGPLSAPPLSYRSYVHLSILSFAALFFFSLVCPHLTFFSLCALLSFSLHGRTTSVVFCTFLGRLHHSCCPSNVFISDVIPPCHSTHPSQHPRLIYF